MIGNLKIVNYETLEAEVRRKENGCSDTPDFLL